MTKSLCEGHQEEQEEDNELQEQYNHLQRDWDAYKQSTTRHRRSVSFDRIEAPATPKCLCLLDNSPKKLLTSLQANWLPTEEWNVWNNDLAAGEDVEAIVNERRSVVKSAKLKGRRLFEEMESEREDQVGLPHLKICRVCPSGLIQGSEAESSSSWSSMSSSDDGFNFGGGGGGSDCGGVGGGGDGVDEGCYSSSSSFSAVAKGEERGQVAVPGGAAREGDGGDMRGGRWMIRKGWLAIVLALLHLGLLSLMIFNVEGDEDDLIPT